MLSLYEDGITPTTGGRWRSMVALTVLSTVIAGAALAGDDACPAGLYPTEFHDANDLRVLSLELADLDQDGVDELLALCTDTDVLRTYALGLNGRYTLRDEYAFDTSVFRMATGDLNEDGRADVVVVSDSSGKVFIRLAEADGSLGPEIEWSAGNRARGVVVEDLDGDGHLDVAKANSQSLDVSVFHGVGDGTYDRVESWPVKMTPKSMTADDIDQDGDMDLIVGGANDDDGMSILRNQGNGTFVENRLVWSARQIEHVTVADLDGDGYRDIVTCNDFDGADILMGRPGGVFAFGPHFDAGVQTIASDLVDADGDGDLDLLLVTTDGLFGWRGDGAGGFSDQTLMHPQLVGFDLIAIPQPERQTVDVIGPAYFDFGIIVSRGVTGFEQEDPSAVPTSLPSGSEVVVHDLNGDAWPDVVARMNVASPRGLVTCLGQPDGRLVETQVLAEIEVIDLSVVDLTGDEVADLLTVERVGSTYVINARVGNGDGTFGEPGVVATKESSTIIAVGNANRDAHPDLFMRTFNSNGQLEVAFGSAAGTFEAPVAITPLANSDRFDVADMTGDGIDDIVVSLDSPSRIDVFVGDGRGGYVPHAVNDDAVEVDEVMVRDVDQDGEREVLLLTEDGVRILRGSVSETFSLDTLLPIRHVDSVDSVEVGDVNGDLIDDIVVDAYGFFVFLGDPSGEFVQVSGHLGGRVADLALADMNLDGAADVVIATATSVGGISVFLNQCDTTSCPADLDGSGSVDFADLLAVLGAWGTDGADVTGDGFTDFDDVVAIIAAWGAC